MPAGMTAPSPSSTTVNARRVAASRRSARVRLELTGWAYAAPTALVVLLLFLLPIGMAIWMSMNDWPLLGTPEVNFPDNYTDIPSDDLFMQSVVFTIQYTAIITVVLIGLGLFLALLVEDSRRRGVGFLRTAYFVPAVVGLTAAALLFYGLYSPSIGPLDPILEAIGFEDSIDWLGTPTNALLSTVLLMTWRFAGFYMLILLTGLHAIPVDVYEAARIDGAGRLQMLRYVTLPLLKPALALCLVLIITGAMLAFEQFYVLTRGGPDNATVTMVMAMFRQAFSYFDLGKAAALAVVILIGLVALNAVQLTLIRRRTA